MKPKSKIVKVTLRLPTDVAQGMSRIASTSDRSMNGEIVNACRMAIEAKEQSR